jgi:hypothetical protein
MPTSRAAALRDALQEALGGQQVHLVPRQSVTRVSAPAPDAGDWDRWRRVIAILAAADDWGSSSTGGTPEIWAEVKDEVSS